MQDRSLHRLIAVTVSLLVVTGTVPIAAAGLLADNPTEPRQAISGSEFVEASDNVEVWERAALPLRVDPNSGDTVIKNLDPKVSVSSLGISRARLDKDELAIHDDESELTLRFQSKTFAPTDDFAGQDAQLVAAHVEEDTAAARELIEARSTITATEAIDLLTAENVNDNVHFDLVEDYGTFDGDGELPNGRYDLSDEDRGAGLYVFFVVQDYDESTGSWGVTDGGFEETDGNLDVSDTGRVLGVDVAVAHQQPADVSPDSPRYAAGEDITFQVDANQDDGDVTHSIVVYDPRNFENRELVLEIDGELDESLDPSQVTVRREIEAVNGVAKIEGSPSVFGIGDLQDGRVSGVVDGARLIDFVAEQASVDAPLSATTSDPVTLDASVTVTEDGDEATVTVETLEDWDPGSYKYVYVATGEDSSEITSAQGRVAITPPMSARKSLDGETETSLDLPSESNVENVRFGFSGPVSGQASVSELSGPPSGVPSVRDVGSVRDLVYLDISAPSGGGPTTVTATFKKSSLGGVAPGDLALWHYTNGEWVELETTLESETATTVTISAEVDGFSPFALAESSRAATGPPSADTGDGDGREDDALYSIRDSLSAVSSATVSVADDSDTVRSVTMAFDASTSGQVRVEGFERPPAYTAYPGERTSILTVLDLEPPRDVRYDQGTVSFDLERSALDSFGATAEELRIERYDTSASQWETLETTVVETSDDTVTISAEVPDFGTYVVSRAPAQAQTTATATPTPTDTPTPTAEVTDEVTPTPADDSAESGAATEEAESAPEETDTSGQTAAGTETTSTQFPGLGVAVTLVAFVMAIMALTRRR